MSYRLEQLILVVSQGVVVGYLDKGTIPNFLWLETIFANNERHNSKLLMIFSGTVGRQKVDITREMLKTYLETVFSQRDIAKLLTVSEKNIWRKVNEYNLREEFSKYTNIIFCLNSQTLAFTEWKDILMEKV